MMYQRGFEAPETKGHQAFQFNFRLFLWGILVGGEALLAGPRQSANGFAGWSSLLIPNAQASQTSAPEQSRGHVTFCRDIAPIAWKRCAPCHRPGQAGPFSLLTSADLKRHQQEIAEVLGQGSMPPWPPAGPVDEFVGDRRLTMQELDLFKQWIKEGADEGNPSDLPPAPHWEEGWTLGKPDLVVTMPTPYTLGAEGPDQYRNFVIPVPVTERRYVRAWELKTGNARIVHHAFLYFDRTRRSRRLANQSTVPGFPAMEKPDSAQMPEGHFMSCQPGQRPKPAPKGMAWLMERRSDLVLQVHMRRTGKPETLQASVGFYFTDEPPIDTPVKILLTSLTFEIPPGEANYVVSDSFQLPVDATLNGILPHAHYLAREIRATATLPNGAVKTLLLVPTWNFNWQGDYQFAKPPLLPAGTVVAMRFSYDNSTNHLSNPTDALRLVAFGDQSTDEMAELWLQLVVRNEDKAKLAQALAVKTRQLLTDRCAYLLRKNPDTAKDQVTLGTLLFAQGKPSEALPHFTKAISLDQRYEWAYFNLGVLLLQGQRTADAQRVLEAAVQLDPLDSDAQGSLGLASLRLGHYRTAMAHLEQAVSLNPDDAMARESLGALNRALAEGRVKLD
jgi:tetratricopeptide (TPR) repeat protein